MLTIFFCVCHNNIDQNSHTFLQDGTFQVFAGGVGKKVFFLFFCLFLKWECAFAGHRQNICKQNSQPDTPEQCEVTNLKSVHSFCSFSHVTIDLKTDLSQQL